MEQELSMPIRRDMGYPKGAWAITKDAYRQEGYSIFFRGLGVCSIRAFVVNAVQVSLLDPS